MPDENAAVGRAPGVLADEVGGRTFLVGSAGTHVVELNAVGSAVWDALDGVCGIDELVATVRARMVEVVAVPDSRLRHDVLAFVGELRSLGLVNP